DRSAGDGALGWRDRGQPTVAYQPVEQLSVMHDLAVDAELRILVLQCIQAVCARRDDLGRLRLLQGVGILQSELLVDELISGASRWVTRTRLTIAEYGIAHAGEMQQFRDRSRGLLGAVFVRPGAADPEQVFHRAEVLDVLPDDRHRKGQILG